MSKLTFNSTTFELNQYETVLDCLLRHQQSIPYACRAGMCQACLIKAVDCDATQESKKWIKEVLQEKGYTLACQWVPDSDVAAALPTIEEFSVETSLRTIEALNDQIYDNINDGAYKAGFSSNQEVYARAFSNYFDTLAALEKQLASDGRLFLTGNAFTEADLRLFPTLFRHDPVYFVRMKLNGARILDFPQLWRWLCRVYAITGVAESNSLIHCRQGYFGRSWNNVVALGPLYPMSYPKAYKHPELVDHLT